MIQEQKDIIASLLDKKEVENFPGGAVDKNPPVSAGDTVLITGPLGRRLQFMPSPLVVSEPGTMDEQPVQVPPNAGATAGPV